MVQRIITIKFYNMIHCIAADDEPLALQLLQDNISRVPYLKLVAGCRDAFEVMKVLQDNHVDLIFVDIHMPGLSGLQLIASMEQKPLIIFITAYKQYALESYDLAVVDYLVKPVPMERFIKACNRARELHELKQPKQQPAAPATDYFFVNIDYSQVKIVFNDIAWAEGLRDYVRIHLTGSKKPLVVRTSLKEIELSLPANRFIRIHKSYLVAIAAISAVRKNSVFIKEMELPVGETFREAVDKLVRGQQWLIVRDVFYRYTLYVHYTRRKTFLRYIKYRKVHFTST
jgi:DNA-binding LytR/AlgR family response regulator